MTAVLTLIALAVYFLVRGAYVVINAAADEAERRHSKVTTIPRKQTSPYATLRRRPRTPAAFPGFSTRPILSSLSGGRDGGREM